MLDFVLSDAGQALWANAYLRPVRGTAQGRGALPAGRRLRAPLGTVDYGKMAEVQKAFSDQ